MQLLPSQQTSSFIWSSLLILAILQLSCYFHFKVYRGLWRFASINDLVRIMQAVVCATALVVPVLYLAHLLPYIPFSIFPMYALFLSVLLCGGRLVFRMILDRQNQLGADMESKRIFIVGAGFSGEGLIRDLKRSQLYVPVGLVDDHLAKRGLEVHGVQVLGVIQDLPELVSEYDIDLIFIAIPSARSVDMRRIVSLCDLCNIPFRTLPSIQALASGRVEVNALRKVNIEDLLGRDQVRLEWDKIALSLQKKRILVTGGGGSIGSELCRQIMALAPLRLLVMDNSESNLYHIDLELKKSFPGAPIELALVNVVDKVAVDESFRQFQPEIVFHAAAYKHVPMLEDQIRGAVLNNIIGTQIIAEASVAVGVEKFVLISTDKAVNPTNIMGTTKRVAEIYCQNLSTRVTTQFITVRFGNVLGSVGSVVPLFQKQLEHGGPLTVTHPDIQRYFMSIPEASQLILQAMVSGDGGEIFVLDMGEPIKISYLAEQMIRLSGKEPGRDVHIEYTGLRPGEKLFEELFHSSESLVQTEHEKLLKARFRHMDWEDLISTMRMLNTACADHEKDELIILLKSLVPEFSNLEAPALEISH
ncbi:MAG: nucleoside-diphosphate sugar epimerase/dehydratase [Legionellales bacterium]|nr:nucleoside-diphosphate sugar epimerase/dehydratase [Legionellales bacterium]